jgi:hypothetical protein
MGRRRFVSGRAGSVAARAAVLLALAPAAFASADQPGERPSLSPAPGAHVPKGVANALGDRVTPLKGDLYAVPVAGGATQITHGPDTVDEVPVTRNSIETRNGLSPGAVARSRPQRAPICSSDYGQRILYAHLPGTPNRINEEIGTIRAIVRNADYMLNRDALDSGAKTGDYKVMCDSNGLIHVDSITTSGLDFQSVVRAVTGLLNLDHLNYTVFVDGNLRNLCGTGSFLHDELSRLTNLNNQGGGYSVVYRQCWYAESMMHEAGHNQGAVQTNSPNSTGTGSHCYEERDVLCYSPDGGDRHQSGTVRRCSDRNHFDCNYNDYFDTAPTAGTYLATHWNIGSSLNRFIGFSQPSTFPIEGLTRGVSTMGSSAPAGDRRPYSIRVPRHARGLNITLRGGTCSTCGNLDLYLAKGHVPSPSSHRKASVRSGSIESVTVRRPKRGRWYAAVYTRGGTTTAPYSIRGIYRR